MKDNKLGLLGIFFSRSKHHNSKKKQNKHTPTHVVVRNFTTNTNGDTNTTNVDNGKCIGAGRRRRRQLAVRIRWAKGHVG